MNFKDLVYDILNGIKLKNFTRSAGDSGFVVNTGQGIYLSEGTFNFLSDLLVFECSIESLPTVRFKAGTGLMFQNGSLSLRKVGLNDVLKASAEVRFFAKEATIHDYPSMALEISLSTARGRTCVITGTDYSGKVRDGFRTALQLAYKANKYEQKLEAKAGEHRLEVERIAKKEKEKLNKSAYKNFGIWA